MSALVQKSKSRENHIDQLMPIGGGNYGKQGGQYQKGAECVLPHKKIIHAPTPLLTAIALCTDAQYVLSPDNCFHVVKHI